MCGTVVFLSQPKKTRRNCRRSWKNKMMIGEVNETYERYVFNSRDQEADESIDTYVAALQKSALTCNLRSCLHDSIIIVLGMRSKQLRKRLLQERKRALSKCIDIDRPATSSELQAISGTETEDVNKIRHRESRGKTCKTDKTRDPQGNRKTYLFCGGEHAFKKEKCPTWGTKCLNCGGRNHLASVSKIEESTAPRRLD